MQTAFCIARHSKTTDQTTKWDLPDIPAWVLIAKDWGLRHHSATFTLLHMPTEVSCRMSWTDHVSRVSGIPLRLRDETNLLKLRPLRISWPVLEYLCCQMQVQFRRL
jgi:hypothetical protein